MKALILNLPNENSIVRRFICSMNSPGFLFPPLELSYLAAIAENTPGCKVYFIDAIASRLNEKDVSKKILEINPDIVMTILGYEHCGKDIDVINNIFNENKKAKIIVMGYLPTVYPREMLGMSKIDIIIRNEPEDTFKELLANYPHITSDDIEKINGITFKKEDGEIITTPDRERIYNLDMLPFPARHLWDIDKYSEPFFGKPFTTIQTARGCPYKCSFCTRTYGNRYTFRSVGNILKEIKECVSVYKIKNFRFIDDTFPINKKRTLELCKKIIDENLFINWVCLTRIDLMDRERLELMKRSGCKRVYIGIESGSNNILKYYKKGYSKEDIIPAINRAKGIGLEVVGYFVIGSLKETESDFQETLEIAKKCKLDLVSCARMAPYPGTDIFVERMGEIEFSINPFVCRYKSEEYEKELEEKVRTFYKQVYLNPSFILRVIKWFMKYPLQSISGSIIFFKYLLGHFRQYKRNELI